MSSSVYYCACIKCMTSVIIILTEWNITHEVTWVSHDRAHLQGIPVNHLQLHKRCKDPGQAEGDERLLVGVGEAKLPLLKAFLDHRDLAEVLHHVLKHQLGLGRDLLWRKTKGIRQT